MQCSRKCNSCGIEGDMYLVAFQRQVSTRLASLATSESLVWVSVIYCNESKQKGEVCSHLFNCRVKCCQTLKCSLELCRCSTWKTNTVSFKSVLWFCTYNRLLWFCVTPQPSCSQTWSMFLQSLQLQDLVADKENNIHNYVFIRV